MIKQLSFAKQSSVKASNDAVAAFERTYGLRLPQALVEFCLRWNGGLPEPVNSLYPVPKSFSAFYEQFGPENKGVVVDGLYGLTGNRDAFDLEKRYLSLAEMSTIPMLPIAFDLLDNYVVMPADSALGPVYWWENGLWEKTETSSSGPIEAPARPHLVLIADDLETFYNSLTANPF
jgi:hypothetical protein